MDNVIDKKIGEIIKDKRKSLKMTQTDLAKRVGTTTQCIYYYENGKRGLTMSLFFKICDVLNLSPNEIQSVTKGEK